jgi:hypothetical protein
MSALAEDCVGTSDKAAFNGGEVADDIGCKGNAVLDDGTDASGDA